MTSQRKKQLLWLLGILLLLKFVGQPLVQWQNDKVVTLAQASERLAKMQQLEAAKDLLAQQLVVATTNQQTLKAQFPSADSASDFRLKAQQRIGELAEQYNLDVDMFNWSGDAPIPVENFQGLGVTTEVSGRVLDIAAFHAAVNSQLGFLIMEDSELSFRGALTKSKVGNFEIRAVAVFQNADAAL
ncbi:hypothetical protein LG288_02545 [Idiomarina seosinensis]|uniref:hypothetical protein n=1 Tax=Idiomarina seosinensis TaxID=281739 RepID=UPI003850D045